MTYRLEPRDLESPVNLDSVLQAASSISSVLSSVALALGYYFMVRLYREWIHPRQEARAVESGALVVGVDPNGPAAKTGIEVGSVITGIDDRKVEDVGDLLAALRGYRPGDEVEIATPAKGQAREVSVELGQYS